MQFFARLRVALVSSALLTSVACFAQSGSAAYDAVNPIIGTDGGGNTFPGATMPFGMMQWSPDTNTSAWYYYKDKQITGFGLTHISGAGCPLYGDFAVLPIAGELAASPGANLGTGIAPYAVAFDHSKEEAHPGFYAVTLANGVRVELAVGQRSGMARFIFPEGQSSRLLVNAGSSANTSGPDSEKQAGHEAYGNEIALVGNHAYTGSVSAGGFCSSNSHYKLYVSGEFDTAYKSARLWQDDAILADAKTAHGKHTGVWLDFGSEHEVRLKVGISYVSQAGAEANLQQEIPGWDFDGVHQTARQLWSQTLGRIAVEGGTAEQRTLFYTGLYHSLLSPTVFSDHDGKYIGFDNQVHSLSGTQQGVQYANFSDWDIYRNTVQLQALLDSARESDMAQSLVNDAVQSGWYPRWEAANDVTYVMGGDSPVPVITSAYAFGAHSFDTDTALKYMVKAATEPGVGPHNNSERPFIGEYLKLGYVPNDNDQISASRTLEYASDDFSIAQFAKGIGNDDAYKKFLKQSENWKNLLDPTTGWIRARNADGSWLAGFDPEHSMPKRHFGEEASSDQLGFEEGNTWQYSFMIPFDYPALFKAMDAAATMPNDKVIPRLDRFFLKLRCWGEPCYNIENEPDFVVPYAYVFAGQPWKTQEVVTRLGKEVFKNAPEGIPGNDDLGATSGVYVWDALGLYPAVPGVGGLVLGTPMFDKATLRLAGGRTLVITRQGSGIYVQNVTLDNANLPKDWLPVSKLHSGINTLDFTVSTTPDQKRGTSIADRPPSFR
jgi:predicted alpha-1,2-mannosidase